MSKIKIKLICLQKTLVDVFEKLAWIFIGEILIVIAFNSLLIPNGLLASGLGGAALIGDYLFKVPVYWGIFILNIPIFIWGLRELDRQFMVFSLIGTFILMTTMPLLKPYLPVPQVDLFLASIFSGVINGFGCGILFKYGASCGGTDIIAMIMKKKRNISIGTITLACNIAILTASVFFFDLKVIMYTAVSMWIGSKITDYVFDGVNHNKSVMIISGNSQQIAKRIIHDLKRGVTYLEGRGAYTGKDRTVINCVVNNFEIVKIREIVHAVDRKAFVFITETVEVMGEGFTWKNRRKCS